MQTTNKVQTGDVVTGTSTSINTTWQCPYTQPKAERGWECPRCGRINAPWVRQCDCSKDNWTINWNDTTKDDDWWKKYVTCSSDTFKIHPDEIVYTTANNVAVSGSDYWDNTEKIWTNILKNVSNIKESY